MPGKTVVLAGGLAAAIVVAGSAVAVHAMATTTPPDLGPPIVAPSGTGGSPAPGDGARPVLVPPRVAGEDHDPDDDDDDLVTDDPDDPDDD